MPNAASGGGSNVTSDKIVDGTIIDEDVASNADIAPSKIALIKAGLALSGNTTTSPISWDTEVFDTGSFHEGVTNPTRITIPATGTYLVTLNVAATSNVASLAGNIKIQADGTTIIGQAGCVLSNNNEGGYTITGIYSFTANQYIEALFENGGNTLTVIAVGTSFTIVRLS